jgi:hypothetical protein
VPDDLDLSATERAVLSAPDRIARAAAVAAADAQQRWLLRQPRVVRRSFVRDVLDSGKGSRLAQERWLLLQDDNVRLAYIREVLERA